MNNKENRGAIPEQNAPIMLSNLESNELVPFGENEIEFTQNTVPFDFDGLRLLWMHYVKKDERDVYIYEFESKTKTRITSFSARDGLISHMKFLGDCLYYVRNTKDVIRFDMKKKTASLVGTAKDAILCL